MKINNSKCLLILFITLFFSNCSTKQKSHYLSVIASTQSDSIFTTKNQNSNNTHNGRWTIKDFYKKDALLKGCTDSIYESINYDERAAQMIMPATSEYPRIGLRFSQIMYLYSKRIIGGVLFLKGRESEFAKEIKLLNDKSNAKKILSGIFSCDCEPTLFHKKFTDQDSLPSANLISSPEQSGKIAKKISDNMIQNGLSWNFAPVTDISENKEIIDKRSFGNNPEDIISKSIAFINSSSEENVATTLKHFPGHGAVKGDSHHELVFIDSALTELNNFVEIINKSLPVSIMIGHIAIKNHPTLSTNGFPSSLSKKIITGLLKDSLGFKGIVVSDAMNMGAVKKIPNADFLAILAGNDVIVYPQNPEQLHRQIINILKSKGHNQEILQASIKKIIRLKICLGIIKLA